MEKQSQYLGWDRDIRELIGARQLHIADIVAVDQQAGLRSTSSFQAWSRKGLEKAQPVSLGIFSVDSETNRCGALKVDKELAHINSVFVPVEPKGRSENPLLYPVSGPRRPCIRGSAVPKRVH